MECSVVRVTMPAELVGRDVVQVRAPRAPPRPPSAPGAPPRSPVRLHPTTILTGMLEEVEEGEALAAITAVSISPSKEKPQPKRKRPLSDLNPELRMAAARWARRRSPPARVTVRRATRCDGR